jgi:hypothetical protein
MMTELVIELSRIGLWVSSVALPDFDSEPDTDYGEKSYDYEDFNKKAKTNIPIETIDEHLDVKYGNHLLEDKDWFLLMKKKAPVEVPHYYPCDKRSELFVLQKKFIEASRGYSLEVATNGSK